MALAADTVCLLVYKIFGKMLNLFIFFFISELMITLSDEVTHVSCIRLFICEFCVCVWEI